MTLIDHNLSTVLRTEYAPPAFWIDSVELEFDLAPRNTVVTARLRLRRNEQQTLRRLELEGEQLELQGVWLDGEPLGKDRYSVSPTQLVIDELPDTCQLETRVVVHPADNTSLYGLYQSSGTFCTQCEALGFRRITYFLDRPDVMATYQVTIRADRDLSPILLSNGNRVSQRDLDDGRQEVVWQDPFPKPSYLFALVAGDLKCHRGSFTTCGGRDVALEIWVEPQNIDRCEHALVSLQKSMLWDEQTFGLEYDLDIYMIVAVDDFNMGAMENKGLNVFNSKYVLALPETATDSDYLGVEAVIAHEYFHNWTGNRVTCRDWFQLTLKEGLTVFRDQQFTADQTSASVKRIDDVRGLRQRQFSEDAGPMAHPIRPESYISMDNFYTATVYSKGAEIIRIYHTLLGVDGFRRGMDLYFERHDGSAVTCDDFRAAMSDANGVDLTALDRWYSQPGTPVLEAVAEWDSQNRDYTLHFKQWYPPLSESIPGAVGRTPVPIPIAVGLLDKNGDDLPLQLADEDTANGSTTRVLRLDTADASFTFTGLTEKPTPSVLRGFSAPVRLRMERSHEQLAFLMAHDSDSFNRWESGQDLATHFLLELAQQASRGESLSCSNSFSDAFGRLLADESLDGSFKSLAITLPSEAVLGQATDVCDPDAMHAARQFLRTTLAAAHRDTLLEIYDDLAKNAEYRNDKQSIDRRRLKSTVLGYLSVLNQPETTALVLQQFESADNMTDSEAALTLLADLDCPERDRAFESFYEKWQSDTLVLDKWFCVQALSQRSDAIECVTALTQHAKFTLSNPNRVRALLSAFAQNQVRFHRADGAGYKLLGDYVLRVDATNAQLASRLVSSFNSYRRFDENRQTLMRSELMRVSSHDGLSKDVREIVERALNF